MIDQLKIETTARRRRTIFPAMVECSNAKVRPPVARMIARSMCAYSRK
jgi:hypothetical protein